MDTPTQAVPGYYVWQPEGSRLTVHLKLDVIDRLGAEVMRGFGLVPKRGAEVGGILLGAIQRSDPVVVRIDDFEPVPCNYKRGPSFLLSEEDGLEFRRLSQRNQPGGKRPPYAVGYYRSHTRDGSGLAAEDLDLLDRYFSDPDQVALLVRPFATKPSLATFLIRTDGAFAQAGGVEFPFRRFNLTGEETPRPRALSDRSARRPRSTDFGAEPLPERYQPDLFKSITDPPKRSRFKSGWVWIPVSLLFLLLGVLLGFQSALTMSPQGNIAKESDYRLTLAVTRADDNLTVRWNREAPVIRAAARGTLEIEDGGFSKSVDLDYANLESGSIIYRNSSDAVHFRLVVYLSASLTVTESLEWVR